LRTHIAGFSTLNELDDLEHPTGSGDGEASATLPIASHIDNIKITQEFIHAIHCATLENGNLDDNLIDHLHNSPEQPANILDPDIWLSLDLFLAVTNASEETYKSCHDGILRCYPGSSVLSYVRLLRVFKV
jgi:hypothetical protein